MVYFIKKRKIEEPVYIGVQGDNNVETHDFVIPRMYGKTDLSLGAPFLLYEIEDTKSFVTLEKLDYSGDTITLRWTVTSIATEKTGRISLAIKISDIENALWQSEIFHGEVMNSIPVDTGSFSGFRAFIATGNSPMQGMSLMMTGQDVANEPHIIVAERSINIPAIFSKIAVQNDANSETVYIDIPRYFDGHDLSKYAIYLNTFIGSKKEKDVLPFIAPALDDTYITCEWVLKPPQTSEAGALDIQITIEGTMTPGSDHFQWSTDQTTVNIIALKDASPYIPAAPSIMADFLQQMSIISQQVHADAIAAEDAAYRAEQGAGSLEILGYKTSLTQLQITVPNPAQGDTYAVGTVSPYSIYIWDATNGWMDNGKIQGPPGTNGIDSYMVDITQPCVAIVCDAIGAAIAGQSFTTNAFAYKGITKITPSVGTITGQPTGMTIAKGAAANNEIPLVVTITTGSTFGGVSSGRITIPITVGALVYTQVFSWAKCVAGTAGAPGTPGASGAQGIPGTAGTNGAPGPNTVSTSTTTNITGLLKGLNSTVAAAISGTDYVAPSALTTKADLDATGKVKPDQITALFVDKTTNYTLTLADQGATIRMNSAAALTVTLPLDASINFPTGAEFAIKRQGTGTVTVVATGGVIIQSADGALSLRAQYSGAMLKKDAANTWWISGDIE